MAKSTIPWHIFLAALTAQSPATICNWLQRWRFSNYGVLLAEPERSCMEPSCAAYGNGQEDMVSTTGRPSIARRQPAKVISITKVKLKAANRHLP
jgi:hypothetical protein